MIYLIVSLLFYALNNLLWKKVLQHADSWVVMTARAFLTTLIGCGLIFFYSPHILSQIDLYSLLRVSFASVLGAMGLICMLLALQKGTMRQLGIFNLVTIAFTVSYLLVFDNFHFLDYWLGSSLIVSGFVIYIVQIKTHPNDESNFKVVINYTLMSLFFAASGLVHWYNLKQAIPPLFSVVNQEVIVFFVGGIGLLLQPNSVKVQGLKTVLNSYHLLIGMALLIFVAVWTGFLGLKITNPFLASLLPLGTPIVTILLGVLFFKEKWNKSSVFSLLLIGVGAYLLHLNLNQL